MKKTNRKKDPAYGRLGTLPASSVKQAVKEDDALVGHLDADGDVITPPDAVTVPVS